MTWPDLAALRTVAQLSWRDYRAVYPFRVIVTSSLPRAILQVLFVAYIGQFAAGSAGRDFALLGATMQVITVATIIKAGDVLLEDRQIGVLHRLRLGRFPLPLVAATRWWTFVLEGTVGALVAVTVAGLLFGRGALAASVWAAAGLVLLVAFSTSALGMATAAAAMAYRADVFIVNLVSYLLLAVTGVVAPLDRLPAALTVLAHGLPITNGLLALRQAVAGEAWLGHAVAEAAVGVGWLAAAVVLLTIQARRARAKDSDDRW